MEKDVRREEIVIEEKVQHKVSSGREEMTVGQSECAESAAKVYIHHKGGKGSLGYTCFEFSSLRLVCTLPPIGGASPNRAGRGM